MNNRYCDVLKTGNNVLEEAGIQDAKTDSWILFEYVFKMTRARYFMDLNNVADNDNVSEYYKLLDKRVKRTPVQYITNNQEFMGFNFYVNENVLIPRQDTEVLVVKAVEAINKEKYKKVLDMCTGSGCIAVSIAKMTNTLVEAADVSTKALEVARKNADMNNVNVNMVESDLFSNITEKYDVIISNPPYIRSKVIEELESEVKNYEPKLALDGKEDGLFFYRRIISEGKKYLNHLGMMMFEIGYDQGMEVSSLLKESGFDNVVVYKDLPGLDRVVVGTKKD